MEMQMGSWNYFKRFCSSPAQSRPAPPWRQQASSVSSHRPMQTQIFTEVNGGESELTICLSQYLTQLPWPNLSLWDLWWFFYGRVCCICFDFSRYYSRCLNKQIKTFSQMIEICWIYFFLKFLHLQISYTYFKSFTILHDFYYIKTI